MVKKDKDRQVKETMDKFEKLKIEADIKIKEQEDKLKKLEEKLGNSESDSKKDELWKIANYLSECALCYMSYVLTIILSIMQPRNLYLPRLFSVLL